MNLKIIMLLTLLGLAPNFVMAGQYGESISRLYRRLDDLEQRYTIMQELISLDDAALEPFFLTAIDELVYGELSQHRTNRATYDLWVELTLIMVRELGELKAQSASSTIWDIARTTRSSLLKAECLISIGRMNANAYISDIAKMLHVLNLNQRPDKENAEIEAYGAVLALSRLRSEQGFEALFYAAIGWYKDRVTDEASRFIMDSYENPVLYLSNIIESADRYSVKHQALAAVMRADAAASSKVDAMVSALKLGGRKNESKFELKRQLTQLRMDAIRGYSQLGTSHPEMPDLLAYSVKMGDADEKLLAIRTLGSDGSDEAVKHLDRIVVRYIDRQNSGVSLSNDELQFLKQCIFAIADSGSELGLGALSGIMHSDFTPAVKQLAEKATEKIQDNMN